MPVHYINPSPQSRELSTGAGAVDSTQVHDGVILGLGVSLKGTLARLGDLVWDQNCEPFGQLCYIIELSTVDVTLYIF